MHSRRDFLERSLKASSLFALGGTVPMFVANTAHAAEAGKETVLVVLQLNGGNDGLNTIVPYEDDEYHKARPTLALKKKDVIPIENGLGFNKSLQGFSRLYQNDSLAIVQGVGYPNPNRSHFESMDVWNTADPKRRLGNGWLGRGLGLMKSKANGIPAFHIGDGNLPLALKGAPSGVPSLNTGKPFGLNLGGQVIGQSSSGGEHDHRFEKSNEKDLPDRSGSSTDRQRLQARKQLIHDVSRHAPSDKGGLLDFVKQTSLTTYTSLDRLHKLMEDRRLPDRERYRRFGGDENISLSDELSLVARMIKAGFGTRVFYLSYDGFDTHSTQRQDHDKLLRDLARVVQGFFEQLNGGDEKRVLLLTFSEFGRRVKENGSKGTDHGAGSCLFLAGPSVKNGGHRQTSQPETGRSRPRRFEVPHRLSPRLRDAA